MPIVRKAIAKHYDVEENLVHVFWPKSYPMVINGYEKANEKAIEFRISQFKDVVFLQQANGLWTSSVLELVKDAKELKNSNKELSEAVLCTLVGLKLLRQNFADK